MEDKKKKKEDKKKRETSQKVSCALSSLQKVCFCITVCVEQELIKFTVYLPDF